MDEIANTVLKMSPPVALMIGINAVILAVHKIIPDRYMTIICIVLGGVGAPLLIPETSLAYSVPSPRTALVILGVIFGCLARGAHSRIKKKLADWGLIWDEDTAFYRRVDLAPLPPKPAAMAKDGEPVGGNEGQ